MVINKILINCEIIVKILESFGFQIIIVSTTIYCILIQRKIFKLKTDFVIIFFKRKLLNEQRKFKGNEFYTHFIIFQVDCA